MSQKSYTELQEKYAGQFIAIKKGNIIATGKSHKELVENLKRMGVERKDLTFQFIEPTDALSIY